MRLTMKIDGKLIPQEEVDKYLEEAAKITAAQYRRDILSGISYKTPPPEEKCTICGEWLHDGECFL